MNSNKRFSGYSALFQVLSLPLLGITACIVTWLFFVDYRVTIEIPVSAIHPETGRAYYIDLHPIKWPFVSRGDSSSRPTSSTAMLREDASQLRPAHSPHQEIRDLGGGRFSHWGEGLYFSASDNSDPRINNRKYILEISLFLPLYYPLLVGALLAIALIANRRVMAEVVMNNQVLRWTWKFLMPIPIGSFVIVLIIGLGGEAYFRLTTPFGDVKWPGRFDPQIGFLFEPNAELRFTNHLDFWVIERTNSLGFADREVNPHVVQPGCRVVFIGDSMVEAVQVRNDEKVQVVLEKKAAVAHPEWQLNSWALGYSGTGQLNQIPFYDLLAHKLLPKFVILVFTSNDFANNSSVLEALRNGWNPDLPPRLFARRHRQTGTYEWIQIEPDWSRYVLKTEAGVSHDNTRQRELHTFFKDHSLFYGWLWRKLALFHPEIVSRLEGPTLSELIAMRVEALRRLGRYQREFEDWDNSFNLNLNIDGVFYEEKLPKLFSDALGLTEFALREFQRRVKQDEGHLAILTTSQLSLPRVSLFSNGKNDPLLSRRVFLRLEAIAQRLGIPVIDQYNYIVQNGGDLLAAQFRHDSHWTPQGHVWAADTVLKYLEQNPQICHPQ